MGNRPDNPPAYHEGWLTREEAARKIGVSTKTIANLEAAKKLHRKNRSRPGLAPVAVYHPDDIARVGAFYRSKIDDYLEARRPPAAEQPMPAFVLPPVNGNGKSHANGKNGASLALAGKDSANLLEAFLNASRGVRLADRVYLKFAEAVEFSGLPEGYLRGLVKSQKLKAITEGVRGWRIRRTDLEAL